MIGLWIKAATRYRKNRRRADQYLSNKSTAGGPQLAERPIVLDLHTPQMLFDSGRHPLCIAINASLSGSATYLRCSRLLLGEFARKQFGKALLTNPAVTWLLPQEPIPTGSLVLTDAPGKSCDLPSGSDSVAMLIGRDIVGGIPAMPYPMHPSTLSQLGHVDLGELRSRGRSVQLLFAGRWDSRYGHRRMEREFGVMNRLAMLAAIRDHRRERVTNSLSELTGEEPIALIDSRSQSVDAADWLPTLSSTRFFVCCPGAAQPMCHNVIEAMSVGAIPILEYSDRFVPSLQNEVNAICFQGIGGLRDALDRIDRLSEDQIHNIRLNVIEYYDRYLRGDQFLRELKASQISMPFNNKNFYRAAAAGAARQAA